MPQGHNQWGNRSVRFRRVQYYPCGIDNFFPMRHDEGGVRLSASDLIRFAACTHASRLDFDYLNGIGPEPADEDQEARILSELGIQYELKFLQDLEAEGKTCIKIIDEVGKHASFDEYVQTTRSALFRGSDVIYQGAFAGEHWGGYVDFLIRVERRSELGNYAYEVLDTKLKRSPDPAHILQLVVYSDLLADIQGVAPEYMHVQLGTNVRASYRLSEFVHYVRAMQRRLETLLAHPRDTRPVPCTLCDRCRWRDDCTGNWKKTDSLYQIAGIRKDQVSKLEKAGVSTMTGLARSDGQIPALAAQTLADLRMQAELQVERKSGAAKVVARPYNEGRGFDLLPRPQEGDLFYDIEGYPHYREQGNIGLEYLHGIWDGHAFTDFWAHNHAEERASLKALFAFFESRLKAHPEARIYHYAPYEMTALRRITTRYGFGETLLDGWQREGRFVDLYSVVRGGIFASEKSYSLKDLEVFYLMRREGEVTTSGGSVLAYHDWLQMDRDGPDAQNLLKELRDYNEIDCISTEKLRDWLLTLRPDECTWHELGESVTEQSQKDEEEFQAVRQELDGAHHIKCDRRNLLYDLRLYHKRESKTAAWAVFDAGGKETADLIRDSECLGGLWAISQIEPVKRSVQRTYQFQPQSTKIKAGSRRQIKTAEEKFESVEVLELDRRTRKITLKISKAKADLLARELNLLPDWAIQTQPIQRAIQAVLQDQIGPAANQVAGDLLSRSAPRFTGDSPLGRPYEGTVEQMIATVSAMDQTLLTVQGPPGTGKTYVTSRSILSLVGRGQRVAVSSNSHEAILNVLIGCAEVVESGEMGLSPDQVLIVHKGGRSQTRKDPRIRTVTSNADRQIAEGHIVGGTAWLLCREELGDKPFDYLFVDEAGQVSFANLLGMTRCAHNVVLVGDPCQLPQVIQGSHPYPADQSCLEWMLGEDRLVSEDRGLFLGESWRMHPALCRYISEQFYEGRVHAHPSTSQQQITAPGFPEAGAFRVDVSHENCSQESEPEVTAIQQLTEHLLKGEWTDRKGTTRPIRERDMVIVAPFNAQVNALQAALPKGIRVGTVDKFQGQEAAIALVSMTSSSGEDAPRGFDFLLSRERINVALSRGKALSLAVASPRLLEAHCSTVQQLRLVNALCALPPWQPYFLES